MCGGARLQAKANVQGRGHIDIQRAAMPQLCVCLQLHAQVAPAVQRLQTSYRICRATNDPDKQLSSLPDDIAGKVQSKEGERLTTWQYGKTKDPGLAPYYVSMPLGERWCSMACWDACARPVPTTWACVGCESMCHSTKIICAPLPLAPVPAPA